MASGSLSFYQGGDWVTFPHDHLPRKPKIQVTHATPELTKFTLMDTDVSVANAIRRIILSEIPTMAIEIVNIDDNETTLFDEFIAHRMGLLPLSSHSVGDIPPDKGFVEYKDCNCFDGCPYCTVEYKLDVHHEDDTVCAITHFDVVRTDKYRRDDLSDYEQVDCVPFRDPGALDIATDNRENGILIAKMKRDNHLRMMCLARKGIAKYHSKWMPVATCLYQFQPRIQLKAELLDDMTLDDKIDFAQSCPRKVFNLDIEDKVQIERLQDCIFCDECVAKARDLGKKGAVTVEMDANVFHFTVEAVTDHGPRSTIDVVRAALRILDYKMSLFLQDAYGDKITEWLPREPKS